MFAKNSERGREISFLLSILNNYIIKNKKANVLDIGFAGSGYIEQILKIGNINYTGLDSDKERILGDKLRICIEEKKQDWRNLIKELKYIVADIVGYKSDEKYDIVMAISSIEHIVPLDYNNKHEFDLYRDIKAVDSMKQLLKDNGLLILTFPCGKEKFFVRETNESKDLLIKKGFIKTKRHNIIFYDEHRINKIINNWIIIEEMFWIDGGKGFEKTTKGQALNYIHTTADPKALCTLCLKNEKL